MRTEKEIRERLESLKKALNPKSFCDGCGSREECIREAVILKWILGEK